MSGRSRSHRALIWPLPTLHAALVVTVALIVLFDVTEDALHPVFVLFLLPSLLAGFLVGRIWIVFWALGCLAAFSVVDDSPSAWTITLPGLVAGTLAGVIVRRLIDPPAAESRQATTLGVRLRQLTASPAVRSVLSRERVDDALDRVRFAVDRFPHGLYQPVASLPASVARRADGCESRWSAMVPVIDRLRVASAVDVGANIGFFSLRLAARGTPTIAIDGDARAHRTSLFALRRSGIDDLGVLYLQLSPANVDLLPAGDCVLFLSVWHHLVRWEGLPAASSMLTSIWDRTGKVMFFDTGETEMPASYRLPEMTPSPRAWISDYLERTCEGSRIEHLGEHAAFDEAGRPCTRNLFAVIRAQATSPSA